MPTDIGNFLDDVIDMQQIYNLLDEKIQEVKLPNSAFIVVISLLLFFALFVHIKYRAEVAMMTALDEETHDEFTSTDK